MKVSHIESMVIELPLKRPHKLAMATIRSHTLVLVRVRTDEGIVGVGEIAIIPHYGAESPGAVKSVIDECLAPQLIGRDPSRVADLLIAMDQVIKGNAFAKAGIEMAFMDIAARSMGVAVSALLGGLVTPRLPVLWVLGNGEIGLDIEEAEQRLIERTHRLFLVKIGKGEREENVARALAIKKALGNRASVRVDVNQGWDEATACWAIKRLQDGGIDVVEQPVAAWNRDAMRRLTERFTVPIMADEAVCTIDDAMAFAREGAADAFSLKLSKHGGMFRTRQVASIAEASGISLFGGTMLEGNIGTAAYAQVFATFPSLKWGCQLFGPQLLVDDVASTRVEYEDFHLVVPSGPGIGIELDEEKVRFYQKC